MNGKITGWGEFKTFPRALGPNNCTIRCIKWTFLLTVMSTLICCVKWKLWNIGATLIIHKPRLKILKVFTQPSSVGTPKMRPQNGRREQAHSGSCTLTNPRGVSHFMNQIRGGVPPCFLDNKETISLSLTRLESHTWSGILSMRKRRTTIQRP